MREQANHILIGSVGEKNVGDLHTLGPEPSYMFPFAEEQSHGRFVFL